MGLCLTRGFMEFRLWVVGVIQIALVACLVLSLPLWKVKKDGNSGQDAVHRQDYPERGCGFQKAVLTAFFCYCALEATAGLCHSYMVLHKGLPQTAAKWASFFYWELPWADWRFCHGPAGRQEHGALRADRLCRNTILLLPP